MTGQNTRSLTVVNAVVHRPAGQYRPEPQAVVVQDGVEPFGLGSICEEWAEPDHAEDGNPVFDFTAVAPRPISLMILYLPMRSGVRFMRLDGCARPWCLTNDRIVARTQVRRRAHSGRPTRGGGRTRTGTEADFDGTPRNTDCPAAHVHA